MSENYGIGYNNSQSIQLLNGIINSYNGLGNFIATEWDGVVSALQKNWVGEDEQDFEKKLAKRISLLYSNARILAQNAVSTIGELNHEWNVFTSKNTYDGSILAMNNEIDIPTISDPGEIVTAKELSFGNDVTRGLTSKSSASQIKYAIDTYVNSIKTKSTDLLSSVEGSFTGEQKASIQSYVERVNENITKLVIAIKKMYDALDTLAKSNYELSDENISEEFKSATADVDDQLESKLGTSRWE